MKDVGKPKAEVAAERVQARVQGVQVTPHFCRIEEKPIEFYEEFHVIILGLDSLEARRYMNQVACSLLGKVWQSHFQPAISSHDCTAQKLLKTVHSASYQKAFHIIIALMGTHTPAQCQLKTDCFAAYDTDGKPDLATIKPLVDGGTEGFKGHARVIIPGFTPCFECTLWLFPPQVKFPLCTLAETPRYALPQLDQSTKMSAVLVCIL